MSPGMSGTGEKHWNPELLRFSVTVSIVSPGSTPKKHTGQCTWDLVRFRRSNRVVSWVLRTSSRSTSTGNCSRGLPIIGPTSRLKHFRFHQNDPQLPRMRRVADHQRKFLNLISTTFLQQWKRWKFKDLEVMERALNATPASNSVPSLEI